MKLQSYAVAVRPRLAISRINKELDGLYSSLRKVGIGTRGD